MSPGVGRGTGSVRPDQRLSERKYCDAYVKMCAILRKRRRVRSFVYKRRLEMEGAWNCLKLEEGSAAGRLGSSEAPCWRWRAQPDKGPGPNERGG